MPYTHIHVSIVIQSYMSGGDFPQPKPEARLVLTRRNRGVRLRDARATIRTGERKVVARIIHRGVVLRKTSPRLLYRMYIIYIMCISRDNKRSGTAIKRNCAMVESIFSSKMTSPQCQSI